jgi:hypothetical protein
LSDNKIEDPEINTHRYSNLIFDKEPETYVGEKKSSSTNGVGKTGYPQV